MNRSRIILLFILLMLNGALLTGGGWLVRRLYPAPSEFLQGLPSVVSRINGEPIYARDLLSSVPFIAEKPTDKELQAALERLIDATLAAQAAEKNSSRQPAVASALETVAHQFIDQTELQAALRTAGMDDVALRDRFARHVRTMEWLDGLVFSAPSEEQLQAWFTAHPEAFLLPEVVEAQHFAAIFPPRGTPAEILARTDLIHQASDSLKNGSSFQEVIDTLSEDPARPLTGGSLFWFGNERIETALANAAFQLPIGEISAPISTRYGFHLLRVSARRPAAQLTFEQAREEIRLRLNDERRRENIQRTLANLRKNAKIDIFVPSLSHHE